MANESRFGLGFIGCGGYAASLADAALRSAKLQPVACFDIVSDRTRSFAEQFGARTTASIEELVAMDEVRGVIIVSPNNAHRSNAEAAAAAGKHVFVDKPIANTIEDAIAIIETTSKAGVALSIGHNGRRLPGHRKMKKMLKEGAVGTPITVEANFSHSGGLGLTPQHWRYYKEVCPGLPLMQLGVHFADTIQYLLGDVLEVSSFMSHVASPADNNDVTVSILRLTDGLLGYLGSNYATPPVYYVNIYGVEGNLYCEWGNRLFYREAKSDQRDEIALEPVDTQLEELEEFAECAINGTEPEVDGRAGLMALAVVRAALKSNEERRPVRIEEILGTSGMA